MGDDDLMDFDFGSTSASDYSDGGGFTDSLADWGGNGIGSVAGQFMPLSNSSPSGYQQTAGSMPAIGGAIVAGAMTLGARLAGMFGRGAGKAVINGVQFSMTRLWPYIRKYGPGAVAGALGISIAQLGALALAAPQHQKHRRRGISARDISTSRRVIKFNRRLSRQLGTGGGGGRRSYYRGRGRGRANFYC